MTMARISASILGSNLGCLFSEIQDVLDSGADWLHIDVMDGHFVNNLSFGLPLIKTIRKRFPEAFLDTHIMVENPDETFQWYVDAGSDLVTFHIEASQKPLKTIEGIKNLGAKVGVSIRPETSLESIVPYLESIDLLLFMSVTPGFGGQKFQSEVLNKIAKFNKKYRNLNKDLILEIDGGINLSSSAKAKESGVDVLVVGSCLFGSEDRKKTIAQLKGN